MSCLPRPSASAPFLFLEVTIALQTEGAPATPAMFAQKQHVAAILADLFLRRHPARWWPTTTVYGRSFSDRVAVVRCECYRHRGVAGAAAGVVCSPWAPQVAACKECAKSR